jgi:hypothetical protein
MIEWLCLVNRPPVEAKWFMTTRDRTLLTMAVLCGLCYRQVLGGLFENGRGIRGKWRILDGKGESVMVRKFRALRMVAPTRVDYRPHQLSPL